MSTLNHDAADLPEASCPPEEITEEPREALSSMFANAARRGLLKEFHHGICALLINQYFDEVREDKSALADAPAELVELLIRFTEYENPKLLAFCYLIVLNKCPISETAIAAKLGVTRAAISKVKVEIEQRLGMKARIGRTVEAREAIAERRRSEPKRKNLCQRKSSNQTLRLTFSRLLQTS